MRYQGKITRWKDDKGFGFITPNGGGSDVFVHITSFANRKRRPTGNESVTYVLNTDEKGRSRAGKVAFAGETVTIAASPAPSNVPFVFITSFLVFVAGSAFAGRLPFALLGFYLVASSIAFFVYALDKSAARKNQWRTAESTLHLLALIGGWPGALAAQRLLRHKSKKHAFQIPFWITVVVNCSVLGWLFLSSDAKELIDKLAGDLW